MPSDWRPDSDCGVANRLIPIESFIGHLQAVWQGMAKQLSIVVLPFDRPVAAVPRMRAEYPSKD